MTLHSGPTQFLPQPPLRTGPPFRALRQQFEEYRSPGRCTLIGGGKTSPDQAAPFNSSLVRYVNLLDSYMPPGGLCHPADNFGTILAAAEHAGASGDAFMLALAIAYPAFSEHSKSSQGDCHGYRAEGCCDHRRVAGYRRGSR